MIIVTGAAGFIGSNLVRGLNALGRSDILVVDDLTRGEQHLNLNPLRFADYVDKDDLFDAISSGGRITVAFKKQFWGDHYGNFTDQFGVQWALNCHATE